MLMLVQCILLVQATCSFITLSDVNVWLKGTSPQFKIPVSYNISTNSVLKCLVTGTVPTVQVPDVTLNQSQIEAFATFNASVEGVSFVICDNGAVTSNTAKVTIFNKPSASICVSSVIGYDETSFEIKLGQLAEADYTASCTCDDTLSFSPIIGIATGTNSTSATYNNTCVTEPNCNCDLKCNVGVNDLTVAVAVQPTTFPKLYSRSFFTKLTLNNMGNFVAYFYPLDETSIISCCLAAVEMQVYVITGVSCPSVALANFSLSGEASKGHYVGQVYGHLNATSGLYGIKCSTGEYKTEFRFQYIATALSNLSGSAPDYEALVVAPCPCDLTESFCDLSCCCDEDCTAEQLATFNGACISGPQGGDHSVKIPLNCSNLATNLAPWERVLCHKASSSPYLGTFLSLHNSRYHPLSSSRAVLQGAVVAGISDTWTGVAGSPVLQHSQAGYGILTLPESIGRSCVPGSPVNYLVARSSACNVKRSCAVGSLLHPRSYLTPADDTINPCKWYSNVKSGSKVSADAVLRVHYTLSGSPVDHLLASILTSTDCSYSVTSVLYTFTWSITGIETVRADIGLENLSTTTASNVYVTYSTLFTSSASPIPVLAGYRPYSALLYADNANNVLSKAGGVLVPVYGLCNVSKAASVHYGVGTVGMCRVLVTEDCATTNTALTNILYSLTNTSTHVGTNSASSLAQADTWLPIYNIIVNTSTATSTTADSSTTTSTTADTSTAGCDNLPTSVLVTIYTQPNAVSGHDIVNMTRTLYTSTLLDSRVAMVTVTVRFVEHVRTEECVLCWERVLSNARNGYLVINTALMCTVGLVYLLRTKYD